MFTENEFETVVTMNQKLTKTTSEEINEKYNNDKYNPRDGELVKAADDLAAFIEAYSAIRNGSSHEQLHEAKMLIKTNYDKASVSGINFGGIYADFD